MKTAGCCGLLGLTLVLVAGAADRPSGPARDEFQDIVVYNIFNPDRGPRPEPKPRPEEKKEPPPPRTETVTLTGVILSDHGAYGFFDGTDRDFQAVRQQGEKLGAFTVSKIHIDSAELTIGTNRFALRIRGELSRRGEEPWQASATSSFKGGGGGLSAASGPATSPTSSQPTKGDGADAERRRKLLELLRKKRESGK